MRRRRRRLGGAWSGERSDVDEGDVDFERGVWV